MPGRACYPQWHDTTLDKNINSLIQVLKVFIMLWDMSNNQELVLIKGNRVKFFRDDYWRFWSFIQPFPLFSVGESQGFPGLADRLDLSSVSPASGHVQNTYPVGISGGIWITCPKYLTSLLSKWRRSQSLSLATLLRKPISQPVFALSVLLFSLTLLSRTWAWTVLRKVRSV